MFDQSQKNIIVIIIIIANITSVFAFVFVLVVDFVLGVFGVFGLHIYCKIGMGCDGILFKHLPETINVHS